MDDPIVDPSDDPKRDDLLDAPTEHGAPDATSSSSDTASEGDGSSRAGNDLDAPTEVPGPPRTPSTYPVPGQAIDDYELIREIARGGMGVVYLAKQKQLNRFVALKMVLESDSATDDELARFSNEAQAAAALNHPGIVPVYEVGSYNGHPFFSMAYVEGRSLAALLNDGPLTPEHAARLVRDVAVAIAHAHSQKIIHRDIKPANILIDSDGNPSVTDFGVCKSLASHSQLTSQGELIGTPHYMPPEQAGATDNAICPQSDVYSMGAVLYAAVTARPPFQAPSPIDVVAQVMRNDPVPPRQLASGVPHDLETIILKCLAKSPADRYATAQQMADDLHRFIAHEPITAKPPGAVKRLQYAIRKHVLLASVSGSFAILLVILTLIVAAALVQAQSRVATLTNLLNQEREAARRFALVGSKEKDGVISYDVDRLASAAKRLIDQDRQLAIHLAVHAGRLATKHEVEPPEQLLTVLKRLSPEPPGESAKARTLQELVEAANREVDRELTEFEQAVYGLLDPSHKIDAEPANADGRTADSRDGK